MKEAAIEKKKKKHHNVKDASIAETPADSTEKKGAIVNKEEVKNFARTVFRTIGLKGRT